MKYVIELDPVGFMELAKLDLQRDTYRVLMYLFCKLETHKYLHVSQLEVGKDLNLYKSGVSKSFRELMNHNLIRRSPVNRTHYQLLFNPFN